MRERRGGARSRAVRGGDTLTEGTVASRGALVPETSFWRVDRPSPFPLTFLLRTGMAVPMRLVVVLTALTISPLLGKASVQVAACFREVTRKQGRPDWRTPLLRLGEDARDSRHPSLGGRGAPTYVVSGTGVNARPTPRASCGELPFPAKARSCQPRGSAASSSRSSRPATKMPLSPYVPLGMGLLWVGASATLPDGPSGEWGCAPVSCKRHAGWGSHWVKASQG